MPQLPLADARFNSLNAGLMTAREVAAKLNCGVRNVWRLRDVGDLPAAVRIGRLVRWPRKLIDSWIADGGPKRRR